MNIIQQTINIEDRLGGIFPTTNEYELKIIVWKAEN